MLDGKDILITGGTGSFGQRCTEMILERYKPKRLIVFSRDELKQYEMAQCFPHSTWDCMRYFLGDVRDRDRLHRAFRGVDLVIHAAALKQVPAAEYNPFEAVKTNINGAQNVIQVAIDQGVKRVIALSTDKAANPINLYGATKLCAERLFIAANANVTRHQTRFSLVRYGNVLGSRGSVIPFFLKKRATGVLPITDPQMTRFWITLEESVDFVLQNFERMVGGEVFVPKIPSMNIVDLGKAIAPECEIQIVGIRPGEKLHEVLVPKDDARNTIEYDGYFVTSPQIRSFDRGSQDSRGDWQPVSEGFEYASDTNPRFLTIDEMAEIVTSLERKPPEM